MKLHCKFKAIKVSTKKEITVRMKHLHVLTQEILCEVNLRASDCFRYGKWRGPW